MKYQIKTSRVVTAVLVLGGLALMAGCCEREAITSEEEAAPFSYDQEAFPGAKPWTPQ